MSRFVFSLASVARLRRAEREQARGELAIANERLRAAIITRDTTVADYRALKAKTVGATRDEFTADQTDAALAAQHVAEAERGVSVAAAAAALARIAWTTAERNVAALERLEERQREEWQIATERADAALLDDVVNAAYVRRRANGIAEGAA